MHAIKTRFTNTILGAPRNWDQEQLPCDALWVEKAKLQGIPVVNSYWKLTEEELAWMNANGCIRLSIVGTNMPPVSLNVSFAEEVFE